MLLYNQNIIIKITSQFYKLKSRVGEIWLFILNNTCKQ